MKNRDWVFFVIVVLLAVGVSIYTGSFYVPKEINQDKSTVDVKNKNSLSRGLIIVNSEPKLEQRRSAETLSIENQGIGIVENQSSRVPASIYESNTSRRSQHDTTRSGNQYQLLNITRKYGLQFLPESILVKSDIDERLRNSRRYLEQQLIRDINNNQLIALANEVGDSQNITHRFEAQKRHLKRAENDSRLFEINRARAQQQSSIDKRDQIEKQNNGFYPSGITQNGFYSQQQRQSANKVQSITRSIESLRRDIVATTSNKLAKLQVQQLGQNN